MHVPTAEPVVEQPVAEEKKTPPQVVIPNSLTDTKPTEEATPQKEKAIFVKAGPVPIYFNAKDVKIEREQELLKQYCCVDGKPADGIGLEILPKGGLGVAFWRGEPTEKDPKAGHWEHHASLSTGQLYDFHMCFQQYDNMANIQSDLQKEAKALEARGKRGIALMIDDKFRRKFAQLSHMQMKINDTFRKVWFRVDKRI